MTMRCIIEPRKKVAIYYNLLTTKILTVFKIHKTL